MAGAKQANMKAIQGKKLIQRLSLVEEPSYRIGTYKIKWVVIPFLNFRVRFHHCINRINRNIVLTETLFL